MCITEYKEELHLKNVRDEGREEGKAEGRAEGEARMSKLVSILINQQKYEELKKVTTDADFREKCYTLYNI